MLNGFRLRVSRLIGEKCTRQNGHDDLRAADFRTRRILVVVCSCTLVASEVVNPRLPALNPIRSIRTIIRVDFFDRLRERSEVDRTPDCASLENEMGTRTSSRTCPGQDLDWSSRLCGDIGGLESFSAIGPEDGGLPLLLRHSVPHIQRGLVVWMV